MKRTGTVSLWAGMFSSPEDFRKLIATSYAEDGDFVPSDFAARFGIGDYDENFFESHCFDQPETISKLIGVFSYHEVMVERFARAYPQVGQAKANAIILLYDYEYDGHVPSVRVRGYDLRYIGAVPYR